MATVNVGPSRQILTVHSRTIAGADMSRLHVSSCVITSLGSLLACKYFARGRRKGQPSALHPRVQALSHLILAASRLVLLFTVGSCENGSRDTQNCEILQLDRG